MILATRGGSNREFRMAGEWGYDHFIPRPGSGAYSRAGIAMTEEAAYGIPAVSAVIRSAADIVASVPYIVYNNGPTRTRAEDSWQWRLLHDQPSGECSSFDFFYDLVVSLEATGNAFIRKTKFRKEVIELEVLDPHRVALRQNEQTGEKIFDVYVNRSTVVRNLTTADILHVRGFTPNPGSIAGVSLLELHRDALGNALAMQRFEGDYFRNSAQSPVVITGAANPEHAEGLGRAWNDSHQGVGNQWRTAALWGQIDVKALPVSMRDALFVESKRLAVEDVCIIWNWPKELLGMGGDQEHSDDAQWWASFLKRSFLPRLKRIERAFAADKDLYGSAPLFGEFLTAALERADFVTRTRGYKDAIQGGWVSPNEIRGWENLPPKDGGDDLQQTPVGGAPNAPGPSDTNTEESNA